MKRKSIVIGSLLVLLMTGFKKNQEETSKAEILEVEIFETSANGNSLTKVDTFQTEDSLTQISIDPEKKFQTITGFGGAFTESSANA